MFRSSFFWGCIGYLLIVGIWCALAVYGAWTLQGRVW